MEMADMEQAIANGKQRNMKRLALVAKARVEGMDDCWLVENYTSHSESYARVTAAGKRHYAHRLAAMIAYGSIPDGMTVSHLCEKLDDRESRKCINPKHLAIESIKDNLNRSPNIGAKPCYDHRTCRFRWTGTTEKVQ